MKEQILENLNNATALEKLYRSGKSAFKTSFLAAYPEISDHPLAKAWYARLQYDKSDISWGTKGELTFLIVACFIAGLIAKIPDFTSVSDDFFYPRNLGFVVFPALSAYFAWKQNLGPGLVISVTITFLIALVYINLLPVNPKSDTLLLACIHLPLFLWSLLGFTFAGGSSPDKRLDFLRYNGDLVVMSALILISGALLTAVTFGLFELINISIQKIYGDYVIVWGLASAPLVATFLVQTNPQLVDKVSPVIAKVFTPLVLITLVVYLAAILFTGKDPYNDREFLLIFNLLLIGVMAIILFSIAETGEEKVSRYMLFALSLVTVLVNGIALSAIIFRIAEWGITPNRLAVLGGNTLIMVHLLLVSVHLFKALRNPANARKVQDIIARYLPVYSIWTLVVALLFPLMFSFR